MNGQITLCNPALDLNISNRLSSSKNHVLSPLPVKNISSDLIQSRTLENTNKNNDNRTMKDTYRPTYVSYLSKTLPRGPYLQYKFKDQQNEIKNNKNNDNNSNNNNKPHQNLIHQHLPYYIEQNYIKDSANTIKSYSNNNNNIEVAVHPPRSSADIYRQHEINHKNHLMTSTKEDGNYQNIDISNYGITLPYSQPKSNMKSGQLSYDNYDQHVQQQNCNVKQLSDCEIYKNCINPIQLQEGNTHQYNYTKNKSQQYQYNNCKRNEQNLAHINGSQTLPHNLKKTTLSHFRTEIESYQNSNNKELYKSISQYQNKIDADANSNQVFNKNEPEIKINHFEHLNINSTHNQKENVYLAQGHESNRNPNMFAHTSNKFSNNNNRCENENKNTFPEANRFSDIFLNKNYYLELLDMNFEKKSHTIQTKPLLTSQIHYVTLADVGLLKSEGLNEIEGWAILCQSVQALQDLFLSDTPSITKVLPLVKASTIQITTRGRIVFNLTSIGEFHRLSNAILASDTASYFDITAHISPEYLNSMGKKMVYPESHVEKMWIYSLGITLRKTLKSQRYRNSKPCYNEPLQKPQYLNKASLEYNHQQVSGGVNKYTTNYSLGLNYGFQTNVSYLEVKPTLDEVIDCMCEKNFYERCSLMFLLDVISKYFRNQKQIKPISHIVMDIVKEVALHLEGNYKDEEIGKISENNGIAKNVMLLRERKINRLKINRDKNVEDYGYDKYSTIGNIGLKDLPAQTRNSKSHQLIVRRKKRRQDDMRRNTIDVNISDLKKASDIFQYSQRNLGNLLNFSKSTNYIDTLANDKSERFEDKLDRMRLCDISVSEFNIHNTERDLTSKISSAGLLQRNVFNPLTKARSEESFLSTSNGPEFIKKSILSSRELNLYNNNSLYHQTVQVLLLNGHSVYISCNSLSTTTEEIFEAVLKSQNYTENFFLGLCVLIGGDFVFLPNNFKIYKVAPQNWLQTYKKPTNYHCNIYFTLFLRIKFFLPTLRGVSSLESRHMLYLQLRKSILEKNILCTDDDLIILSGLALQAEIGDFKETLKYTEYFTLSHYLPENVYCRNKEMAKYLRNSHYSRRGVHKRDAEKMFITYIQGMKEYGYHLYSAIWMCDDGININIYVGISLDGIALFERNYDQHKLSLNISNNNLQNSKMTYQKKLYVNFEWLEIENLCFSKHILCIVVRKTASLKAKDNNRIKYKIRMDDKKSFFAFNLASEHHQFYMRLKNSFISLKSISDELNIPITLTKNLKYETTNSKQSFSKEFPMCMVNDNNNHNKNPKTNSSEIVISENLIGIDKQSNTCNGGIVGGSSSYNISNDKNCNSEIMACTIGSTVPAVRAKNTKKSMLNENRLLKFKEKYLRRTKSTAGCEVNSISIIEKIREKKTTKVKSFKNLIVNALYNNESDTNSNRNKITKEEHQNKENECPRNNIELPALLTQISSQSNDGLTTATESETSEEQFKAYSSPNRNRVKMGTRVFSSKILNKSFDNIYERFTKSHQFDSLSSLDVRGGITANIGIESTGTSEDGGVYASIDHNCDANSYSTRFKLLENQFDYDDDNVLTKKTSVNNLYSGEKDNLGSKYSITDIPSLQNGEAYVIHSSITSDWPCQYNNFTLPNETLSESLIEKFNNISNNSSAINERKLTKITVIKERINIPPSQRNGHQINCTRQANHVENNSEEQEIIIPGNINYATISLGTIDRQLVHTTSKNIETLTKNRKKQVVQNDSNLRNQENLTTTSTCWHQDDSNLRNEENLTTTSTCWNQDSIFIDNHFSIKNNNLDISKKTSRENNSDGFTLGISIIQGSSGNNVYVKDLIQNGPGEKAGIQIGDQIIAVNGVSLLNLSYNQSLRLLQNSGRIVELIVSQLIFFPTKIKYTNYCGKENGNKLLKTNTNTKIDCKDIVYLSQNVNLSSNSAVIILSSNKGQQNNEICKNQINCQNIDTYHENVIKNVNNGNCGREENIIKESSASQQMNFDEAINPVNKQQWKNSTNFMDIPNKLVDSTISARKSLLIQPKEIAILCKSTDEKSNETVEYASVLKKSQRVIVHGQSRKYLGPIRYPVTPMKGNSSIIIDNKKNLSLLADDNEHMVI